MRKLSWRLDILSQSVARLGQAFAAGAPGRDREEAPTCATNRNGHCRQARLAVLKKQNVAGAPLLGRAGLSEHDFDGRQHRVSSASQAKFLEFAAEAVDDSAFGLHLAEDANPREEGLLFYVTSAAPNIREALTLHARYCRIANEAVRIKPTQGPEGIVAEISFIGLPRHTAKQATEFGVAVTIKALREIAGRNIRPTHLSFIHARNSDLQAFQQFFGCPVEFGASGDRLAFSNETLALRLVTEDRHLLETLRPICDEAAKERGTASGTLRALVENEAQKLLPHGKAKRHRVAKSLGLSERTLTRKLADEGTTYEQVSDQLRRSVALQYIKNCVVARLRGIGLFQSCFQAMDGPFAISSANRELLSEHGQ